MRNGTVAFRGWGARLGLAILLGLTVMPGPAEAQQRAQLERRIREQFVRVVQTRLDLDDDQAQAVSHRLEEFRQERLVLASETRSLRVRVANAVEAADGDRIDDQTGSGLLAEMLDLAEREAALVADEQQALLEVLTPGQVVLFYQLRDRMTDRIQQLRRGTGVRRPGN